MRKIVAAKNEFDLPPIRTDNQPQTIPMAKAPMANMSRYQFAM